MKDILYYLDNLYRHTPIPVVAARENVVIYQNPVATDFFGADFLGYLATKYFRGYPYPDGAYVYLDIMDMYYNVSAAKFEGVDVMTVFSAKENDLISTIPVSELSAMNASVSTLFLATEKLIASCPDDNKTELYSSVMFQNFHKLLNTTELLSTMSRLQLGIYPTNSVYIDLGLLLSDLSTSVTTLLEGTGINFKFEKLDSFLNIYADQNLIQRMILSIISNSIRHTPSGGTITLSLRRFLSDALITITDTGSGMPPEKLSNIFELNHIVREGNKTHHEGGLGLPFVSHIAKMYDGSVMINSSIGVGTVVSISIKTTRPPELILRSPSDFPDDSIRCPVLSALASVLPRGQYTPKKIFGT